MKRFTFKDMLSIRLIKKSGFEIIKRDKGEVSLDTQGTIITGRPTEVIGMLKEFAKMGESKEVAEIRDLANKLNVSNSEYQEEILNLRKDKAALIAFIEANIKDETLKNTILPKQGAN